LKFLQEIGYDDIFNVDEVNEIKALYDKAQEEIKENFENEFGGGATYKEKLEQNMIDKDKSSNEKIEEKKNGDKLEIVDGQAKHDEDG